LLVKKGGFSKETLIDAGKILLRMIRISRVYVRKKHKTNLTAKEFGEQLLDLIGDMHSTFVSKL